MTPKNQKLPRIRRQIYRWPTVLRYNSHAPSGLKTTPFAIAFEQQKGIRWRTSEFFLSVISVWCCTSLFHHSIKMENDSKYYLSLVSFIAIQSSDQSKTSWLAECCVSSDLFTSGWFSKNVSIYTIMQSIIRAVAHSPLGSSWFVFFDTVNDDKLKEKGNFIGK